MTTTAAVIEWLNKQTKAKEIALTRAANKPNRDDREIDNILSALDILEYITGVISAQPESVNTAHMTETQARIVLALADNEMRVYTAAIAAHYSRTNVDYHLRQIRKITGLNPKNFYDLYRLVQIARATLREETEKHD